MKLPALWIDSQEVPHFCGLTDKVVLRLEVLINANGLGFIAWGSRLCGANSQLPKKLESRFLRA